MAEADRERKSQSNYNKVGWKRRVRLNERENECLIEFSYHIFQVIIHFPLKEEEEEDKEEGDRD